MDGLSYIPYNAGLKRYAKKNRQNPTLAEKKIWQILSRKQFEEVKFTRQKPLESFITDFYCSELKLVIEIDGDSHASQPGYDQLRSDVLREKHKIKVVRYSNHDILRNSEGVYEDLVNQIRARRQEIKPPLTPP
ncbi:MAG: endonuclease domain-containing protein [Candidatus Omnitrophica bacterium]|nr:endonuclease domain-containing protein [Candidatus Omnitrophota bacterium]